MNTPAITAVHRFTAEDFDNKRMPFEASAYARLKYGDDSIAKRFGFELAEKFFTENGPAIVDQPTIVIPSPYNFVKNAATVMADHFVRRLNRLIADHGGRHVDYATIQRKSSFAGDYGSLGAEERRKLISGDTFYVHEEYFKNKTLVFVDDIRITGAHEDRIMVLLDERPVLRSANIHFLYYGQLCGDTTRNDIEGFLNNAEMTLDGYLKMQRKPGNHVIVRPIKWLLRMDQRDFAVFLRRAGDSLLVRLYDCCLGQGYHLWPEYTNNFTSLKKVVDKIENSRVVNLDVRRNA